MDSLEQAVHGLLARHAQRVAMRVWIAVLLAAGCAAALIWRLSIRGVAAGWLVAVGATSAITLVIWIIAARRSRRSGIADSAATLDRTLGLDDRLLTALEFSQQADPPALYPTLLQEVRDRLERAAARLPSPVDHRAATLAIVLLLLMLWPLRTPPFTQLAMQTPRATLPQPEPPMPNEPPPTPDQQQSSGQGSSRQPQSDQGGGQSPNSSQPQDGSSGASGQQGGQSQGGGQQSQSAGQSGAGQSAANQQGQQSGAQGGGQQQTASNASPSGGQQGQPGSQNGQASTQPGSQTGQAGSQPGDRQQQSAGGQQGSSTAANAQQPGQSGQSAQQQTAQAQRVQPVPSSASGGQQAGAQAQQGQAKDQGQSAQQADAKRQAAGGQGQQQGGAGQQSQQAKGDTGEQQGQGGKQANASKQPGEGGQQMAQAGRGAPASDATKQQIQQLLQDMSGEIKQLQAQLAVQLRDQPGATPGTSTDSQLYDPKTGLERMTGPGGRVPIQLQTDAEQTSKRRAGTGVGAASSDIGRDAPLLQDEAVALSDQRVEESSGDRQQIPPEYRGVFERLSSQSKPEEPTTR